MLRQRIRAFIEERLDASENCAANVKELKEEIQKNLGVSANRFRSLFGQPLPQFLATLARSPPGSVDELWGDGKAQLRAGPKAGDAAVSLGEQEMRAQRAARFQSHLQVERVNVPMVSFNDNENLAVDGGPIIGALTDMCSREEAREREQTRQLDKFEWKKGTDPRNPEVNLSIATKKYQRSSADKAYRSQDVRNLEACWKTMEFLMAEIMDFDMKPKPEFAVQDISFIEVYSYLRDRTRSVRVDLHLQQPRSTTQRTFIETHECCLRFEMLSLYLLMGEASGGTERYDHKLGLKAISQTIEPLLNAYTAVRDKQMARSILAEAMGDFGLADENDAENEYVSPWELAVHRYIILLLMSFSPEELLTHLAKLSREMLSHPVVSFATRAFAAFRSDDVSRFLRLYREADFLTAVAMSGVADLARLRALWLLVRTYPGPIGDKIRLSRIKHSLAFASDEHARSFLSFYGVQVESGADPQVILPKKGTPEAAQYPLLNTPNTLPERCEYPKGADSMLVSKFEALGASRADIVCGGADPVAVVETVADVAGGQKSAAPAAVDEKHTSETLVCIE